MHVLDRSPRVFSLQLAWERPQEAAGDIAATLAAVDERVRSFVGSAAVQQHQPVGQRSGAVLL